MERLVCAVRTLLARALHHCWHSQSKAGSIRHFANRERTNDRVYMPQVWRHQQR